MDGAWKVFSLFVIPVGGGIPAGVLLAKSLAMPWYVTVFLYFLSDVLLACVFDPLMHLFSAAGRKYQALGRVQLALRTGTQKSIQFYGNRLGPFALIMIAFGVDPMTGRVAAAYMGHGFLKGWMFAISGDLLYFGVIMVSTLTLNGILGNGTATTVIILVLMFVVPSLVRRYREKKQAAAGALPPTA